jgi:two-component system phosphate regulon response regulator PhoB
MKKAMLGKKVFVVEDEYDIRELLQFNLQKDGYIVYTFENPLQAIQQFKTNIPDVVVTDWLMPEMDGLEFCKYMKRDDFTAQIPLIMITCKGEEIDIVTALELGAEDYMVKPFSIKELSVRIKKILSKNKPSLLNSLRAQDRETINAESLKSMGIKINKDDFSVSLNNMKLDLTYAEFNLIKMLSDKPGKVFTRSQIIENDYGNNYYVTERSVDVKIVGLRKKLGEFGTMIKTIRSVGYMLEVDAVN